MAQRKAIRCPEDDDDCTDPRCSVNVCASRQARILGEQREAKQEAELQAQLEARHRRGVRERAAMRAIREYVREHNARIDANEPGIARKNRDGEVYKERVRLPDNQKARRALVDQALVLASQKPEWAARVERAVVKATRKSR